MDPAAELSSLLTLLQRHGLHAHVEAPGGRTILGGRAVSTAKIGTKDMRIYQGCFLVTRVARGWNVGVEGEGQAIHECTVATADEVLAFIAIHLD